MMSLVIIILLLLSSETALGEDKICSNSKEQPKQNVVPLKFCHIFPETSCCLPVQDAEIEEHYLNLIEAGDYCAQGSSKAKDYLKALFCFGCSPLQPEFIGPPFNSALYSQESSVIRVCKSVFNEIHPTTFSDCGMTVVAERGNVCAGDDTVVPKFFWPDCLIGQRLCLNSETNEWTCSDTECGLSNLPPGVSDIPCTAESFSCNGTWAFLNDNRGGKPPYFEDFAVEILDEEVCERAYGADSESCKCYSFLSHGSRQYALSVTRIIMIVLVLVNITLH